MVWQVQNGGADTNGGGFRGGAALSTPAAPSVSQVGTGGTVAANTYYVVVTESDRNGQTPKSAEASVTTTGATSTITVTSPTNPGVQGSLWNVYVGTASGGPYFSQGTALAFGSNRSITSTPPTSGTQAPGADRSQQNAAQLVIDNSAVTCTTTGANSNTLTFTAGYTPTAADVGNVVNLTAGTNVNQGWYEITGWSSTTWTLAGTANATTAGGAGSAITGNMGGALATPGLAGARMQNDAGLGMFIQYNATAYSIANSSNVAGGFVTITHSSTYIVGYNTTRDIFNTDALRPTLQPSANSVTVFNLSGSNMHLAGLVVGANSKTGVTAFSLGASSVVFNCKATGVATGFSGSSLYLGCQADQTTTAGFLNCSLTQACVASAVAGGYGFRSSTVALDCVAYTSTVSVQLFASLSNGQSCISCSAYSSNQNGTGITCTNSSFLAVNCVAWNTAQNYLLSTVPTATMAIQAVNCGSGSGAAADTIGYGRGLITLTADPFTSAAGNDFSLNSAAGGGALLRAAGYPSSFPGLSTSAYPDAGAAQHADPASTDPGVANVRSGTGYTIAGSSLTGTLTVPAPAAGGMRGGFTNG